ncbi:MAG: glycosyltransferase family 4 protein [Myxococcaceae bacterium]
MRVLLIGDYPPPAGGIAIHLAELKAYLQGCGVQTCVLDIGKGGRPAPDVIPARGPRQFGLRLAQFLAAGWLAHLHTSGNNRRSWMRALATAAEGLAFSPRPLLTVHSGVCPKYLAASAANRLLARAALAGFSKVVAVSPAVAGALEAAGGLGTPPLVLPAFLASQVRPGPPPPGFEKARGRHRVLVAMAHHPSPVYGLGLALSALGTAGGRVPGLGLALFGPGSDSPQVEATALQLGVAGQVERFGELPHEQVLGLLKGCDLFLRPTSADGDSISVREALSLGVRVVASDAALRPEGTVLFPAGSREGLVEALARALEAPPPRVAPADAGPALLALYQSLAAREGGRGIDASSGG